MTPMKALFLLALGLAPSLLAAPALPPPNDVLPAAYPPSRYEKFAQHSPFSPPTAAAPPPAPVQAPKAPGWADSLSVAGATQVGGYYLVTILDRGSNEHFTVSTDPAIKNTRDVTLTSVQWSYSLDQTQVTLQRGVEFAVVKFDPTVAKSGSGSSGMPPSSGGAPRPNTNPLNRPAFPPPPGNPMASQPNLVRRTQPIRATPPPPVVPRTNAVPPGPGVKLPGVDDDDDDD